MNTMPRPVIEKAKPCLLDAYGMALAGHDTPYAPVARAAAIALDAQKIAA
jgi:2-methylcitrate dehydratase PrpD